MPQLPKVVVACCQIKAIGNGVGIVPVVELRAPMPRQGILDIESHIHCAGVKPRGERGRHLPIAPLVES